MPDFPEDLALARRLAALDAEAWEKAIPRYAPLIRGVVRKALGGVPPGALDDAAEEVFLELLSRERAALAAYQGKAPLAAYLAVVARRVALRLREDARRQQPPAGDLARLARELPGLQPQLEAPGGEENLERLRRAMDALPPRYRRVLDALYAGGRTPGEIGRELGMDPRLVSAVAWKARRRLRAGIRKITGNRGDAEAGAPTSPP